MMVISKIQILFYFIIVIIMPQLQWNLYKVTSELCGPSWQVVFHNRDSKHDFVKTEPDRS